MRAALCALMLCQPIAALAQVTDAQTAQIVALAESFSRSVLAGDSIEPSIDAMYPPFASAAAQADGFADAEAMFDQMRLGHAYSVGQLEVMSHEMIIDAAEFGQTGDWTWGLIPYAAQSRWRAGDQPDPPRSCTRLLVFGKDGAWYRHTMEFRSDLILRSIEPDLSFLDRPAPDCANGTS